MSDDFQNIRTLRNNAIKQFILRIDFGINEIAYLQEIINEMSTFFERTEQRIINGIMFKLNNGNPEAVKSEDFDYVLVSESKGISLTFSKAQNALWFETVNYCDSSVYKELSTRLADVFRKRDSSLIATRIGMRFINEFKCSSISDIKKVFKAKYFNVIKSMLEEEDTSRAIAYIEYNRNSYKLRSQFGITNKYYPSVINNYDTIFDIDSYLDIQVKVCDWDGIIAELNHKAYDEFINKINEKYLGELK